MSCIILQNFSANEVHVRTEEKESREIIEDAREIKPVQPSFSSLLFMGEFKPEMLFPYPEEDPEAKKEADQVIEKTIAILREKLDPDEVDEKGEIPQEVMDELKKLGLFSLKVPKEYGGLGFSQSAYNRIIMTIASYCASTAVLLSAHQSIGVPQPLKMFGNESQKKQFLPLFCRGAISAFALTEPDVGSDPARMVSEVIFSEKENCYILNGEKLWCTNGPIAEVIVVIARTAPKIIEGKPKPQLSAFILEMNTPGIEIVHRCRFMGLNGIYNGLIRFTNVRIPKENLLGAEGRGLAMALSTLNVGRLTLPAACVGIAKKALNIAREWGKDRVQWGMPIGLHQAGSEKIAYIASTTFAMEAMTWMASGWLDRGADVRIEAALAKLFCSEALYKIVDLTLQLRGGRGYEKASSLKARGEVGYPVERMLRDCRINTIIEGSSEIMKLFLAREALDFHLQKLAFLLPNSKNQEGKLKSGWNAFKFYTQWYAKNLFKPWMPKSSYPEMNSLAKHFHFIEDSSHRLAREIFYSMMRYQKNLEKQQLLLGRLMDIGAELFAMSSVCSYAIKLHKEEPSNNSFIDLADLFCSLSRLRVADYYNSLKNNSDAKLSKVAKDTLDKRFIWLEDGIL